MPYAPDQRRSVWSEHAAWLFVVVGSICAACQPEDTAGRLVVLDGGWQADARADVGGERGLAECLEDGLCTDAETVTDAQADEIPDMLPFDADTEPSDTEPSDTEPPHPLWHTVDAAVDAAVIGEQPQSQRRPPPTHLGSPCLHDGAPPPLGGRWLPAITYGYREQPGPPPVDAECRATLRRPLDGFDHILFIGDELLTRPRSNRRHTVRSALVEEFRNGEERYGHLVDDPEAVDDWLAMGDPCPVDPCDPGPIWTADGFTLLGAAGMDAAAAREKLRAFDSELIEVLSDALDGERRLVRGERPLEPLDLDPGHRLLVVIAVGQTELSRLRHRVAGGATAEEINDRLDSIGQDLTALIELIGSLATRLNSRGPRDDWLDLDQVVDIVLVNPIDWDLGAGEQPPCEPWSFGRAWPADMAQPGPAEALSSVLYRVGLAETVDLIFAREWAAPRGGFSQPPERRWVDAVEDDPQCLYPNRNDGGREVGQLLFEAIDNRVRSRAEMAAAR